MDVIGLDHLYLSVTDLGRSEGFYDPVMRFLGFRKGDRPIAGEPHVHYFNRALQLSLRPASSGSANRAAVADPAAQEPAGHDAYSPGLHHICFQVAAPAEIDAAARGLGELGVVCSQPALYPEYSPDYYAIFFEDPDGIRLELVARTQHREALSRHWDEFTVFLNPLAALRGETR